MCWDYVDCSCCGDRIQCTANCCCVDEEDCNAFGHQDCKSFSHCRYCGRDICDSCWEDCNYYCGKECKTAYKSETLEKKINQLKEELHELNHEDSSD